jgi:hypothetical protein
MDCNVNLCVSCIVNRCCRHCRSTYRYLVPCLVIHTSTHETPLHIFRAYLRANHPLATVANQLGFGSTTRSKTAAHGMVSTRVKPSALVSVSYLFGNNLYTTPIKFNINLASGIFVLAPPTIRPLQPTRWHLQSTISSALTAVDVRATDSNILTKLWMAATKCHCNIASHTVAEYQCLAILCARANQSCNCLDSSVHRKLRILVTHAVHTHTHTHTHTSGHLVLRSQQLLLSVADVPAREPCAGMSGTSR